MPTPPSPGIPDRLAACASAKTLRLTTIGRRSGKPRETMIWFVVEGSRIYVQAGPDGEKGWYGNLLKQPAVTVAIGERVFRGRATPVQDPEGANRVLDLVRRKYWLARLARLLGLRIGRGKAVAIEIESERPQ